MNASILMIALIGQTPSTGELPRAMPIPQASESVPPPPTWQGGSTWSAPTPSQTKTVYEPQVIMQPRQYQTHAWQQQYQAVPTGQYRCAKCGQYHQAQRQHVHVLNLGPLGYFWWK